MKETIQARLSSSDRQILARLARNLGWSPSKIVREGLRLLAASHPSGTRRRIVGLGKFSSGVGDLGSNKKYLKGFGG